MNLNTLRRRLDVLARGIQADAPHDGPAKVREIVARIEREDDARARKLCTIMSVLNFSSLGEPADFDLLLEAIGPELLGEAFPGGVPPYQGKCEFVRRAARNYRPVGNERNPLTEMVAGLIAKQVAANTQPDTLPTAGPEFPGAHDSSPTR